jgi:ribosomal-protein-alanine N-acetyltransferase
MQSLATTRLHLVPLSISDAPSIQRTFPKWEIVRWMDGAVPWPYPEDGAESYLRHVALPAIEAGNGWHWSLRPREQPDLLIGVVCLRDHPDDNRGFWLAPEWQQRGLMTEASDAVTDFWFEVLGREILRVPKAVDNPSSRRISEKRGMRVIARFPKQLVSGVHDVELWEISRDVWREQRKAAT